MRIRVRKNILIRWLGPAALVVLVLAFWWRPLLCGAVYCSHEIQRYAHPWRAFSARMLASGELPLWNPYASCGFPHQSTPHTAVFYPGSFAFYFLPFAAALRWTVAIHLAVAALGTYWFGGKLGLGAAARTLAAVAFAFCTWLVAWIGFLSDFQTMAWLPVALACFHDLIARPNARRVVTTAAAMAVCFLAGYPDYCAQVWVVLACYAIVAAAFGNDTRASILSRLSYGLAGFGLGVILAAVQLLPTIELATHSQRYAGLDPSRASEILLSPLGFLMGLVLPYLFGGPGEGRAWDAFELWLRCPYVGIATLLLAVTGTCWAFTGRRRGSGERLRPRWPAVFFVTLAVVCGSLASGRLAPPYRALFEHVPFVRWFRWPAKLAFPCTFSLAVLAGYGLQALIDAKGARSAFRCPRVAVATVWVCLNLLAAGGAALFRWQIDVDAVPNFGILVIEWLKLLVLINLSGLILLRLMSGKGAQWPRIAALFLLLISDLFWAGWRSCVFSSVDPYESRRVAGAGFAQGSGAARVITPPGWPPAAYGARDAGAFRRVRESLDENVNMLSAVPSAYGDYSFGVGRVGRYFDFAWATQGEKRQRQLAHAGVAWLIGPDGPESIPAGSRVTWPRRVFARRDQMAALAELDTADITIDAFGPHDDMVAQGSRAATLKAHRAHEATVHIGRGAGGLMLLRDTAFPGWRAAVDGQWRDIVSANAFQRAVHVAKDASRVRFVYDPRAFRFGLAGSLLAVLAAVAGLVSRPSCARKSRSAMLYETDREGIL